MKTSKQTTNRIPWRRALAVAMVALLGTGLAACASGSTANLRPTSPSDNRAVTTLWAHEVRRTAQTGDWILSRSYSTTGDIISAFTTGEDLSHASIYDAERGTIIEALQPVVREVPLESLVDRNHVLIVVRPRGLTQEQRLASVTRARSVVGNSFDVTGLFGVGSDDRFYCSELVLWASQLEGTAGAVVTPSELVEHGTVIYYSGARSDGSVIATARAIQQRDTVRTAAASR
jgi:hypothetical protein